MQQAVILAQVAHEGGCLRLRPAGQCRAFAVRAVGGGAGFLHGALALRNGGDNLVAQGGKRGRAGRADLLAQLRDVVELGLRGDGVAAAAHQRGNGRFQIELRDHQLPDHGKALASERVIRRRMTRP
ncbi:hypothetical protein [Sphingobium terrigena]|uniref:hypothetical protein n=1 Tax=Sphingobium terrigena TaxID=2304063 RepID=UPI001601FB8C|nr:hypothetical protein [Sphingobium terrigena]